jgi:hypothetical protein
MGKKGKNKMSQMIFGEVSWESSFGDKKTTNNKDLFLRLESGDNEVRFVSKPFQYMVHTYKVEGEKGFGRKIKCSAANTDGVCPLCALGNKAKPRWYIAVIDRASKSAKSYKLLDISYAVYSQVQKLAQGKWGDPTKYDINIVVDKNGGATGYYTVQPVIPEPLSAEDQVIKDSVDVEDLQRRVKPLSHAQVNEILAKINAANPAAPAVEKSSVANAKQVLEEPAEDDEFPAFAE